MEREHPKQAPSAIVVIPENYQAIISECAGKFDIDLLKIWADKQGPGGLFVRHEGDPMDCQLYTSDQFHQLYSFAKGDVDAMFRPVLVIT